MPAYHHNPFYVLPLALMWWCHWLTLSIIVLVSEERRRSDDDDVEQEEDADYNAGPGPQTPLRFRAELWPHLPVHVRSERELCCSSLAPHYSLLRCFGLPVGAVGCDIRDAILPSRTSENRWQFLNHFYILISGFSCPQWTDITLPGGIVIGEHR